MKESVNETKVYFGKITMKWHARVKRLGKTVFFARFDTEDEANAAAHEFTKNNPGTHSANRYPADGSGWQNQNQRNLNDGAKWNRIFELTAEIVRALFDYDINAGILSWKSHPMHNGKRLKPGSGAGWVHAYKGRAFIYISVGDRVYAAHRIAWLHFYGTWPTERIYHANSAGTDNRIMNLVYKSFMKKNSSLKGV